MDIYIGALRWVRSKLSIAFALTLVCEGCAIGISNVRYSQATPEGSAIHTVDEPYVGEMFVAEDVKFRVFVSNAKSADTMIFPVPYHSREETPRGNALSVALYLKVPNAEYTLFPGALKFWRDTEPSIGPKMIRGPSSCASQEPPPDTAVDTKRITLSSNSCLVMWLEFDSIPPDPAEIFYFQIGGLQLSGKDIPLPILEFHQSKKRQTFAIP